MFGAKLRSIHSRKLCSRKKEERMQNGSKRTNKFIFMQKKRSNAEEDDSKWQKNHLNPMRCIFFVFIILAAACYHFVPFDVGKPILKCGPFFGYSVAFLFLENSNRIELPVAVHNSIRIHVLP